MLFCNPTHRSSLSPTRPATTTATKWQIQSCNNTILYFNLLLLLIIYLVFHNVHAQQGIVYLGLCGTNRRFDNGTVDQCIDVSCIPSAAWQYSDKNPRCDCPSYRFGMFCEAEFQHNHLSRADVLTNYTFPTDKNVIDIIPPDDPLLSVLDIPLFDLNLYWFYDAPNISCDIVLGPVSTSRWRERDSIPTVDPQTGIILASCDDGDLFNGLRHIVGPTMRELYNNKNITIPSGDYQIEFRTQYQVLNEFDLIYDPTIPPIHFLWSPWGDGDIVHSRGIITKTTIRFVNVPLPSPPSSHLCSTSNGFFGPQCQYHFSNHMLKNLQRWFLNDHLFFPTINNNTIPTSPSLPTTGKILFVPEDFVIGIDNITGKLVNVNNNDLLQNAIAFDNNTFVQRCEMNGAVILPHKYRLVWADLDTSLNGNIYAILDTKYTIHCSAQQQWPSLLQQQSLNIEWSTGIFKYLPFNLFLPGVETMNLDYPIEENDVDELVPIFYPEIKCKQFTLIDQGTQFIKHIHYIGPDCTMRIATQLFRIIDPITKQPTQYYTLFIDIDIEEKAADIIHTKLGANGRYITLNAYIIGGDNTHISLLNSTEFNSEFSTTQQQQHYQLNFDEYSLPDGFSDLNGGFKSIGWFVSFYINNSEQTNIGEYLFDNGLYNYTINNVFPYEYAQHITLYPQQSYTDIIHAPQTCLPSAINALNNMADFVNWRQIETSPTTPHGFCHCQQMNTTISSPLKSLPMGPYCNYWIYLSVLEQNNNNDTNYNIAETVTIKHGEPIKISIRSAGEKLTELIDITPQQCHLYFHLVYHSEIENLPNSIQIRPPMLCSNYYLGGNVELDHMHSIIWVVPYIDINWITTTQQSVVNETLLFLLQTSRIAGAQYTVEITARWDITNNPIVIGSVIIRQEYTIPIIIHDGGDLSQHQLYPNWLDYDLQTLTPRCKPNTYGTACSSYIEFDGIFDLYHSLQHFGWFTKDQANTTIQIISHGDDVLPQIAVYYDDKQSVTIVNIPFPADLPRNLIQNERYQLCLGKNNFLEVPIRNATSNVALLSFVPYYIPIGCAAGKSVRTGACLCNDEPSSVIWFFGQYCQYSFNPSITPIIDGFASVSIPIFYDTAFPNEHNSIQALIKLGKVDYGSNNGNNNNNNNNEYIEIPLEIEELHINKDVEYIPYFASYNGLAKVLFYKLTPIIEVDSSTNLIVFIDGMEYNPIHYPLNHTLSTVIQYCYEDLPPSFIFNHSSVIAAFSHQDYWEQMHNTLLFQNISQSDSATISSLSKACPSIRCPVGFFGDGCNIGLVIKYHNQYWPLPTSSLFNYNSNTLNTINNNNNNILQSNNADIESYPQLYPGAVFDFKFIPPKDLYASTNDNNNNNNNNMPRLMAIECGVYLETLPSSFDDNQQQQQQQIKIANCDLINAKSILYIPTDILPGEYNLIIRYGSREYRHANNNLHVIIHPISDVIDSVDQILECPEFDDDYIQLPLCQYAIKRNSYYIDINTDNVDSRVQPVLAKMIQRYIHTLDIPYQSASITLYIKTNDSIQPIPFINDGHVVSVFSIMNDSRGWVERTYYNQQIEIEYQEFITNYIQNRTIFYIRSLPHNSIDSATLVQLPIQVLSPNDWIKQLKYEIRKKDFDMNNITFPYCIPEYEAAWDLSLIEQFLSNPEIGCFCKHGYTGSHCEYKVEESNAIYNYKIEFQFSLADLGRLHGFGYDLKGLALRHDPKLYEHLLLWDNLTQKIKVIKYMDYTVLQQTSTISFPIGNQDYIFTHYVYPVQNPGGGLYWDNSCAEYKLAAQQFGFVHTCGNHCAIAQSPLLTVDHTTTQCSCKLGFSVAHECNWCSPGLILFKGDCTPLSIQLYTPDTLPLQDDLSNDDYIIISALHSFYNNFLNDQQRERWNEVHPLKVAYDGIGITATNLFFSVPFTLIGQLYRNDLDIIFPPTAQIPVWDEEFAPGAFSIYIDGNDDDDDQQQNTRNSTFRWNTKSVYFSNITTFTNQLIYLDPITTGFAPGTTLQFQQDTAYLFGLSQQGGDVSTLIQGYVKSYQTNTTSNPYILGYLASQYWSCRQPPNQSPLLIITGYDCSIQIDLNKIKLTPPTHRTVQDENENDLAGGDDDTELFYRWGDTVIDTFFDNDDETLQTYNISLLLVSTTTRYIYHRFNGVQYEILDYNPPAWWKGEENEEERFNIVLGLHFKGVWFEIENIPGIYNITIKSRFPRYFPFNVPHWEEFDGDRLFLPVTLSGIDLLDIPPHPTIDHENIPYIIRSWRFYLVHDEGMVPNIEDIPRIAEWWEDCDLREDMVNNPQVIPLPFSFDDIHPAVQDPTITSFNVEYGYDLPAAILYDPIWSKTIMKSEFIIKLQIPHHFDGAHTGFPVGSFRIVALPIFHKPTVGNQHELIWSELRKQFISYVFILGNQRNPAAIQYWPGPLPQATVDKPCGLLTTCPLPLQRDDKLCQCVCRTTHCSQTVYTTNIYIPTNVEKELFTLYVGTTLFDVTLPSRLSLLLGLNSFQIINNTETTLLYPFNLTDYYSPSQSPPRPPPFCMERLIVQPLTHDLRPQRSWQFQLQYQIQLFIIFDVEEYSGLTSDSSTDNNNNNYTQPLLYIPAIQKRLYYFENKLKQLHGKMISMLPPTLTIYFAHTVEPLHDDIMSSFTTTTTSSSKASFLLLAPVNKTIVVGEVDRTRFNINVALTSQGCPLPYEHRNEMLWTANDCSLGYTNIAYSLPPPSCYDRYRKLPSGDCPSSWPGYPIVNSIRCFPQPHGQPAFPSNSQSRGFFTFIQQYETNILIPGDSYYFNPAFDGGLSNETIAVYLTYFDIDVMDDDDGGNNNNNNNQQFIKYQHLLAIIPAEQQKFLIYIPYDIPHTDGIFNTGLYMVYSTNINVTYQSANQNIFYAIERPLNHCLQDNTELKICRDENASCNPETGGCECNVGYKPHDLFLGKCALDCTLSLGGRDCVQGYGECSLINTVDGENTADNIIYQCKCTDSSTWGDLCQYTQQCGLQSQAKCKNDGYIQQTVDNICLIDKPCICPPGTSWGGDDCSECQLFNVLPLDQDTLNTPPHYHLLNTCHPAGVDRNATLTAGCIQCICKFGYTGKRCDVLVNFAELQFQVISQFFEVSEATRRLLEIQLALSLGVETSQVNIIAIKHNGLFIQNFTTEFIPQPITIPFKTSTLNTYNNVHVRPTILAQNSSFNLQQSTNLTISIIVGVVTPRSMLYDDLEHLSADRHNIMMQSSLYEQWKTLEDTLFSTSTNSGRNKVLNIKLPLTSPDIINNIGQLIAISSLYDPQCKPEPLYKVTCPKGRNPWTNGAGQDNDEEDDEDESVPSTNNSSSLVVFIIIPIVVVIIVILSVLFIIFCVLPNCKKNSKEISPQSSTTTVVHTVQPVGPKQRTRTKKKVVDNSNNNNNGSASIEMNSLQQTGANSNNNNNNNNNNTNRVFTTNINYTYQDPQSTNDDNIDVLVEVIGDENDHDEQHQKLPLPPGWKKMKHVQSNGKVTFFYVNQKLMKSQQHHPSIDMIDEDDDNQYEYSTHNTFGW